MNGMIRRTTVGGWRLAVGGRDSSSARSSSPTRPSLPSLPPTANRQPSTRFATALAAFLFALSAFGQTEVVHREDFQTYKVPSNPPGWVDTSIGKPKPEAAGLYKAWHDPLQGNQGSNVVYGTKQSSGKPEGN